MHCRKQSQFQIVSQQKDNLRLNEKVNIYKSKNQYIRNEQTNNYNYREVKS